MPALGPDATRSVPTTPASSASTTAANIDRQLTVATRIDDIGITRARPAGRALGRGGDRQLARLVGALRQRDGVAVNHARP